MSRPPEPEELVIEDLEQTPAADDRPPTTPGTANQLQSAPTADQAE